MSKACGVLYRKINIIEEKGFNRKLFIMIVLSILLIFNSGEIIDSLVMAGEVFTMNSSGNNNNNDRSGMGFNPGNITWDGTNWTSSVSTNKPCSNYDPNYPTANCMSGANEFGRDTASGSSDKDVFSCFGGNSSEFSGDSCSNDLLSGSHAPPPISSIRHADSSTQTGMTSGAGTVNSVPASDSNMQYDYGGYSYKESVFNKLVSNTVGVNDSCRDLTLSNNDQEYQKRCNKIDYSTREEIKEDSPGSFEQRFRISFSVDSMTDVDGNLIGNAKGSFTQRVDGDQWGAGSSTGECTGTFTSQYDEGQGKWVYSETSSDCPSYQ